ncbi:MAG: Protein of unknown function (DUF2683) [Candidatus Methanocomedens sp.]|nr:MAG: Protein of unknown function (DUF2683) [ANME-2 cluster archaeon]
MILRRYIVQAIINIDEHTNRILNIFKAKYGLKDKSSAIDLMATQYEEEILEPELKPEYVEKARKIMRQKPVDVGSVENLRSRLDL